MEVIALTPNRSDLEEVTVTTGDDGSFAITGLHPDTYTLSVCRRVPEPIPRQVSRRLTIFAAAGTIAVENCRKGESALCAY